MAHPERSNDCPYISKKIVITPLNTARCSPASLSNLSTLVFASVYVQSRRIYFAFHFTLPLLNSSVIWMLASCSAALALFRLSY